MQLEDYFEFVSPNEIKLKNHRIYMEDVLYEYVHRAQSLESLTTRFDTLTKAEILAVLLYYHQNKEAMDRYLAQHLEDDRKAREEHRRQHPEFVEKVRRLMAEKRARSRAHG
jgi:uncharacterized protein (DUF433 family)